MAQARGSGDAGRLGTKEDEELSIARPFARVKPLAALSREENGVCDNEARSAAVSRGPEILADRTKGIDVKQFGPIAAGNLTSPLQRATLRRATLRHVGLRGDLVF
jgi:hypothetical protein